MPPNNDTRKSQVANVDGAAMGPSVSRLRPEPKWPSVIRVKGEGNIDKVFGGDAPFRLVFIRMHFYEGSGTAHVGVHVDSGAGEEYDTKLYTCKDRGNGADVNLVLSQEESKGPSPWSFFRGDKLRLTWTDPDSSKWGIEVGIAGGV